MTYTEIQTAIADWFARADLPAATFIALAEEEMARTLRVQGMQEIVSATPTTQTSDLLWLYPYPADFLELQHIEKGGERMEFVSNNQMTTDMDYAYTIASNGFLLNSETSVDIYYYKKPNALSGSNETNLLTDIGSDALLYFSLEHAASYMREPGGYRQQAIERMHELNQMDDRAAFAGAPLVMRS